MKCNGFQVTLAQAQAINNEIGTDPAAAMKLEELSRILREAPAAAPQAAGREGEERRRMTRLAATILTLVVAAPAAAAPNRGAEDGGAAGLRR